MPKEANLVDGL